MGINPYPADVHLGIPLLICASGLVVARWFAAGGGLESYYLLHAVRADLLRRIRSFDEAAESYSRALSLVTNDAERRFLERRLKQVQTSR